MINNPEIDKYGTKYWHNAEGQLHRTDGPAIEYANGGKRWCVEDKLHRTDGPAVVCANGDKRWYVGGKCHRTDGPAIEFANGTKLWYLNGKGLAKEEFLASLTSLQERLKPLLNKKANKQNVNQALLQPFLDEALLSYSEDSKKTNWLSALKLYAQDAHPTGSQVYGKYYRKDSSDKDVIVKIPRSALGSQTGLLSLIGAEQAQYYREGTCRVKIGDVDFILTTEQEIFDNWVNITKFLEDNPPPNKSETVKMFDMMEAGENYENYYRQKHRWVKYVEHMLGQYAEIRSSYCEVIGLYKMGYGTYAVLRTPPNETEFRTINGLALNGLQNYFGERLDDSHSYAIIPITEIKKCVPKEITKVKEENMNESYETDAPATPEKSYKDALKSSGNKMKGHIQHGMAVGAATEGASYAYQQVAHVLKTQFGVSDEALNDPLKRELITFAALAVTHMGATVFDEVPGMDKVTKGCELAIEGKAKDNTGALIQHLLPMLLNVSKAMDPATQMQRIAAEAERQRVALDNSEQDAHTEAVALEEDHHEPVKAQAKQS